jgi:molybdopterin-containing oxidoreductase family iron-sulfur binding subunit
MHWLRIERFWVGEYPDVRVRFLPVLCQHCKDAPCEPVCPVYASYRNPEGLNGQVYNRCVGTRYCGNNCPYAVRVFNFYSHQWPSPLDNQLSPDITVRSRGVMEKCTFCIQRIRRAREEYWEGRMIRDGECSLPAPDLPVEAMVFGNMADPRSRVAADPQPRRFRLLKTWDSSSVCYLGRRTSMSEQPVPPDAVQLNDGCFPRASPTWRCTCFFPRAVVAWGSTFIHQVTTDICYR